MKISCSENLIGCLIQSQNIAVKIVKKNIRDILRIISNSYERVFCRNSWRLKYINYFCKKNSVICVWQGPKYTFEDFFFKKAPYKYHHKWNCWMPPNLANKLLLYSISFVPSEHHTQHTCFLYKKCARTSSTVSALRCQNAPQI